MSMERKTHSELRAKIVAALNLTPLVPPNADTETLNVVEDAWAALSELMRSVEQFDALSDAVRQFHKTGYAHDWQRVMSLVGSNPASDHYCIGPDCPDCSPAKRPSWGPEHPAYDEMGQ